jgi:2-keto-3-deoxy-L-rhamnonate aldolase RhmA
MHGTFRQRLLAGEVMFGTIVALEAPEVIETLCHVGFDWLFIETEHAPLLPHAVQRIVQTAGDTPCVVRLSRGDEISIKRALDAGAAGIIVPQVNSAAHARLIVSYAKFAPMGSRGFGLSRASRYGLNVEEYVATANDTTAVIVQAEHIDAVDNIEEICTVDGIDAVFVGPYDLSASLNRLGKVNDREVVEAIARVRDACRRRGLTLGIHGANAEEIAPRTAEGYTLLSCSADITLLATGAARLLASLRGAMPHGREPA